MKNTCPACDVPWTEHPGIGPTCAAYRDTLTALADKDILLTISNEVLAAKDRLLTIAHQMIADLGRDLADTTADRDTLKAALSAKEDKQ